MFRILTIIVLLGGTYNLLQAQTPLKTASELRLRAEVARLKKLITAEPDKLKVLNLRRDLVFKLIGLAAPSAEIIEAVGEKSEWDDPMFYIRLAKLLADRGEHLDVALEYYDRAVSTPYVGGDGIPRHTFFLTLSYIQIKRGEFEKAIETLTKNHPGPYYYFPNPQQLYYLGLAYEKAGRIDEAIEAYIRLAGGIRVVSDPPSENLRALYRKRYGSLHGLEERIEATRLQARQKVYIEDRWIKDIAAQKWKLKNPAGEDVSLSEFDGNIVVLIFVTTQNQSDVEQLKFHQDLSNKYKDQKVVFICIDEGYPHPFEVRRKNVANALKRAGITLPIVIDTDETVIKQYNSFPSSATFGKIVFLIDHQGMTRFGNSRWENYQPFITDQIDYLLKQQGISAKQK